MAVVLNSSVIKNIDDTISENQIVLWYVWILRYKYQLFNANNGNWYTHLEFIFGEDEILGFWVRNFEYYYYDN